MYQIYKDILKSKSAFDITVSLTVVQNILILHKNMSVLSKVQISSNSTNSTPYHTSLGKRMGDEFS